MADEKKKGFIGEFKEFISRGNVMDMAVGVIIATAFGKITTSLVNDVVMPAIGYFFGGTDLSKYDILLKPAELDESGEVINEAVSIGIGTFASTVIDFIIVAFVVFCVVKAINSAKDRVEAMKKKEEEEKKAEEKPAEPSAEEKLLIEIRDLLKEQKK